MSTLRVIVNLLVGIGWLFVLPSLAYGLAGAGDTGVVASAIVFVFGAVMVLTWTTRWCRNHRTTTIGDQS